MNLSMEFFLFWRVAALHAGHSPRPAGGAGARRVARVLYHAVAPGIPALHRVPARRPRQGRLEQVKREVWCVPGMILAAPDNATAAPATVNSASCKPETGPMTLLQRWSGGLCRWPFACPRWPSPLSSLPQSLCLLFSIEDRHENQAVEVGPGPCGRRQPGAVRRPDRG